MSKSGRSSCQSKPNLIVIDEEEDNNYSHDVKKSNHGDHKDPEHKDEGPKEEHKENNVKKPEIIEHKIEENNVDKAKEEEDNDHDPTDEDDDYESIKTHSTGHHAHHDMVPIPPWAQSVLSVMVVTLIIFIANEYSNVKIIFSFLGATYANINAFILPSLFYLKFASKGRFW